jgi:hypothetical protein
MYCISSKENVTRLTYVFLNAVFQLNSKTAYFRSQVCTKLFSFFFFLLWILFEELALETWPSITDTPCIILRQSQNR